MKKLNYLILGLAGLTLASCSQDDDLFNNSKGDGNVNFTVRMPSTVGTRAMNDGLTADDLYIAVYDASDNSLVLTDQVKFGNSLETNVSLNLALKKQYIISFFAQSPESATDQVYNFNADDKTLTVDYTKMNNAGNLADYYDCFIQKYETPVIGDQVIDETITLYRPISQINWATNDYGQSAVKKAFGDNAQYLTATLTTKAYDTWDLLTNDVTGDLIDVEIPTNVETGFTPPLNSETNAPDVLPITGTTGTYQYVAMMYLMSPRVEPTVYDLNLNVSNNGGGNTAEVIQHDLVVSAAPVQANFQTNIYGSLLTDNVNFNVIKEDKWYTPSFDIALGETIPAQDEQGNYLITNLAELTWVANYVNGVTTTTRAATSPQNINCKLQNDIYMVGNWTPIGIDFAHRYGGTFDGQGNTIYNLSVNTNNMTGFFGFMNGVIKDLNFSNAKIVSNHWAGVVAGFSDNETGSAQIINCNVSNSSVVLSPEKINGEWDNGDKGGLILGYMVTKDQVTGCTVSNCTLEGYRDLGGIIGYANGSVITNNKVDGLKITVNKIQNYKDYTSESQFDANPIIGEFIQGTYGQNSGNTSSNVTIVYGEYITSSEVLADVIADAAPGATINIPAGTYTFPAISNFKNEGITLDCEEGTVFEGATNFSYMGGQYGMNGATVKNATFSNPSGTAITGYLNGNFVNCTFAGGNAARWTYASGPTKFTDCKFNSEYEGYAFHVDSKAGTSTDVTIEFENCDLEGFVAIGGSVPANFTGCNFTSNGIYGGGNFYSTTSFKNCQFYLANEWGTVYEYIRLYSSTATYTFDNCTNNGSPITLDYKFRAVKGATLICNGQEKVFDENVNT